MSDIPRLSELVPGRQPTALGLIRYIACLARTRSNKAVHILETAELLYPGDQQLLTMLKSAVAAGSLSNLSQLAPYKTLASELIQLARPSSIVLRLDRVRTVPLRIRVPRVTASTVVGWVGEGLSKPVSTMAFDDQLLDPKKLAGIVVFSDELARMSNPAAEALIRADLIASINTALDAAFISTAAATSAKPAGILNGVSAITSSGSTPAAIAADVSDAVAAMVAAGGGAQQLIVIGHPATAAQIALTFGGAGASFGLPIIASSAVAVGSLIVIDESEVLIGTEPIELSLSSDASVMLDSAPVPGTTVYQSLWQHNLVGIRSEQTANWIAARSNSAAASTITGIV